MIRVIARQAEAERERRAKVIHAEGDHLAAEKLAMAAELIQKQPAAIQLRYLQTLVEIGSEKNTTVAIWIRTTINGFALPRGAMSMDSQTKADLLMSFVTPPGGSEVIQPLFATAIPPTPTRVTGIGFFDRAHGQTGAAPNVIELHPVLKVEWL